MTDSDQVAEWLGRYVAAWLSYDRAEIAALFSDDVSYRYHPHDEPIVGRDQVVASWLGESSAEGASERDEPDTYEASYRPIAIDGDIAVAIGRSSYREEPGGEVTTIYENCFLIRFDAGGRCREFTEYYVERP